MTVADAADRRREPTRRTATGESTEKVDLTVPGGYGL
jgi:hypothetical protein